MTTPPTNEVTERLLVRLEGVRVAYTRDGPPALACDALTIGPGLTLVVGPNGAGRSTLLRVIAGVERPGAGQVYVLGHDAWRAEAAARARLVYVPEHPELAPCASIREVVRLTARSRGLPDAAADDALDAVGLEALGGRSVRELSMGQRRRVLLAAAFLGAPQVVVLDEPLETMDRPTRATIVRWAAGCRAAGAAVLVATHDVAPLAPLVDAVLLVAGGRVTRIPVPSGDSASRVAHLEALATHGSPDAAREDDAVTRKDSRRDLLGSTWSGTPSTGL